MLCVRSSLHDFRTTSLGPLRRTADRRSADSEFDFLFAVVVGGVADFGGRGCCFGVAAWTTERAGAFVVGVGGAGVGFEGGDFGEFGGLEVELDDGGFALVR